MGNSTGRISLFPQFFRFFRLHGSNDRLPTGMDMDVFDSNFLLTLAAIPLQSLDLHRESPQQLDREVPVTVLLSYRPGVPQPPQRANRSDMRCHHLCREHALDFILRSNTGYGSKRTIDVLATGWTARTPIRTSVDNGAEHQTGKLRFGRPKDGYKTQYLSWLHVELERLALTRLGDLRRLLFAMLARFRGYSHLLRLVFHRLLQGAENVLGHEVDHALII